MKKWIDRLLVSLGYFVIGVLSGLAGVLLVLHKCRGSAARQERIKEKEDELRKKDPDDIVDMLDNADVVRAKLERGPDDDTSAPGSEKLHDTPIWRKGSIF